jgi:hypothetical protein
MHRVDEDRATRVNVSNHCHGCGRRSGRGWSNLLQYLAVLSAAAATVASVAADGDPPRTRCTNEAVRLPIVAPPRTEETICDPVEEVHSGPAAATWANVGSSAEPAWTRTFGSGAYSACWYKTYGAFFDGCRSANELPTFFEVYGYPLNISLAAKPGLGDFLPPSPTLGGTSLALLPPGTASQSTGWGGLQRPVLEGVVDLVTGAPLARFSELQLPFAGATFRLIRTRSHAVQGMRACFCNGDDMWWDWAGDGWMISESPLLLIDSALPDVVGNGPRTTYLVLDAHHTIPFQQHEETGRYEAPARFRAKMWVDPEADWDAAHRRWSETGRPRWYKVSLFEGTLTYTFMAIWEDVPRSRWTLNHVDCQPPHCIPDPPTNPTHGVSSAHERPFLPHQFENGDPSIWNPCWGPGHGIPYYGLCTQIEDRDGRIVEIRYGSQQQYGLDNPQTPESDEADPCFECMQDCPGKGQIHSILLKGPGGQTEWTLLYRYRIAPHLPWRETLVECPDPDPNGGPDHFAWTGVLPRKYDHFGDRVIDSIYVYKHNNVSLPPVGWHTISAEDQPYIPNQTSMEEALDSDAAGAAPDGWLHRVRYHYSFEQIDSSGNLTPIGMLHRRPLLLKVSVVSRRQDFTGTPVLDAAPQVRSWMMEYASLAPHAWLAAIYEPDAVERALSAVPHTINKLALALLPGTLVSIPDGHKAKVQAEATVRWTDHLVDTPAPVDLQASPQGTNFRYLRVENIDHVGHTRHGGEVGTLTINTGHGSNRHYRLRRLVYGPEIHDGLNVSEPHPSVFHVPYAWRGYYHDLSTQDKPHFYNPPEDYTQPRWITIIDEFADHDDMINGATLSGPDLTAPGLIGRRAVYVGASGVILRDYSWKFENGVLTSAGGSGVGTESVYMKGEQFCAQEGIDLPPPPPPTSGPGGIVLPSFDEFGHIRNELLLVEQRSVGWSVADNDNTGFTEGFVRFFEYEARKYDTDPENTPDLIDGTQWRPDERVLIELRAEGVKKGQAYLPFTQGMLLANPRGGPRLYTRQLIRPEDPGSPLLPPSGWTGLDDPERWEYTCDIQFLQPSTTLIELANLPPPGSAPEMTTGPRPEPKYAMTYSLVKRRAEPRELPAFERPVESTLVIGPGRQQRPGGPWYFPVERQVFDEGGKLVRSISGLVLNPLHPAQPGTTDQEALDLQSLSHTVHLYDDASRPRHIIADFGRQDSAGNPDLDDLNRYRGELRPPAALIQSGELDHLPGLLPPGWWIDPKEQPRNYVTTYLYQSSDGGLSDIYFPTGRRWARRVVVITKIETLTPDGSTFTWNTDEGEGSYSGLEDQESDDTWFAREYIFNDIELRTVGGSPSDPSSTQRISYSRMPGEIRDYKTRIPAGKPQVTRRVLFARPSGTLGLENEVELDTFLDGCDPNDQPRFIEERRVQYAVDSSGRIAQADLLERGPDGAMVQIGSKVVNDLVDVVRERTFDGQITRTTRNLLGQPVRRYIGTNDEAWGDLNPATHDADGLALIERIEYGAGTHDVWHPTIVRRYTSNPSWAGDPYSQPPSPDPDGYVTRTFYDWRMRAVRVDQYGETPDGNRDLSVAPRLSTTLTYLDHADRPILVVTFGAGTLNLPEELDPVGREEWEHGVRPPVADFYESLLLKPTSAVETFYGPDGNVVERRTYFYDATQGLTWHEEHTLTGRGNQVVYEQRPGAPVTVSTLDGLGRTVKTAQLGKWSGSSWHYELARTDYLLDADGNVCGTSHLERVLSDGDELVANGAGANAVRTRSVAWFDPQKRLMASAELGSESLGTDGLGDDMLVAGPEVFSRNPNDGSASEPYIEPTPNGPLVHRVGFTNQFEWARLTINRYALSSGRLTWTANPDGSITELHYDRAGRLSKRIENAYPAPNSGEVSRTVEYEYRLGRLTGIRAYRTSDGAAVGETQTTRIVYGAKLLEQVPPSSPGTPPTYIDSGIYHASLVGRMHLPVASTGGPSTGTLVRLPHEDPYINTGDIILRYTFDGQVAERIDARGVVFRYFYDGLGRLSWIVVGSYSQGTHGTFSSTMPAKTLSSKVPADRVMAVQYLYNAEGRLSDVITWTEASPQGSVLTHTRYEYDERGNLIKEWQGLDGHLGQTPPTGTAVVDYVWDYAPTNTAEGQMGHDRLVAIKYPAPPGGMETDRRVVEFTHGATGSVDDRISRLTTIASGHGGSVSPVAQFEYAGVSRRAAMTLNPSGGNGAGAITADLRDPDGQSSVVGLPGLDSFGRLRDLHYRNAASAPAVTTLLRCEHRYDVSGNRLYDRTTQWPSPALQTSGGYDLQARSLTHEYDEFDRLIRTTIQGLAPGGAPIGAVFREDTWFLDLLGNWQPIPSLNGLPPADLPPVTGRVVQGNLDGYSPTGNVAPIGGTQLWSGGGVHLPWQDPAGSPDSSGDDLQIAPNTDGRNEVTGVSWRADLDEPNDGPPIWEGSVTVLHDAAGNLAFDGTYVYQYDAWGRLVQVNAGAVDPMISGAPGYPYAGLVLGPMLKHYTYDGLGRLVRVQSPFPNAADDSGEVRSERLYYDGIRRIQEIRLDPAKSLALALESESSAEQQLAQQSLLAAESVALANAAAWEATGAEPAAVETGAAPLDVESGLLGAMGGGGSSAAEPYLAREYIWGPGDAWHPATVDELLVYFGEDREPWWVLQDSSGDVAAVCDIGGTGATARVVAQQRYDAYGQVTSADHLHPHPFLSVGHKGLFYDRFDRGVADRNAPGACVPPGSSAYETPRLVPFARGVYHVRNRAMLPGGGSTATVGQPGLVESQTSPTGWALTQAGLSSGAAVHGRFMQADPNATGAVLVRDVIFHGQGVQPHIDEFELQSRFRDGANLYQYLHGHPWTSSDPLGLEDSDSEYEEDEYSWEAFFEDLFEVMGLLSPVPDPSDIVRGALQGLIEDYAVRLEWDIDWASDWSMPDDAHSRTDSSWVALSMMRGVYEAFEIDIPFTDRSINPLDWFASASASNGQTSQPKAPVHHIMTNKNYKAGLRWSVRYENLFKKHGISSNPFNWPENKVPLPGHKGPHSDAYHNRIYNRVEKALKNKKKGVKSEEALRKALKRIKSHMEKVGAKGYGLDKPARKRR